MKAAAVIILLLTYIAHAETTGSISIGQPQSPVVSDVNTTSSATNDTGMNASGSIALILVIILLVLAAKIYLSRRGK